MPMSPTATSVAVEPIGLAGGGAGGVAGGVPGVPGGLLPATPLLEDGVVGLRGDSLQAKSPSIATRLTAAAAYVARTSGGPRALS
jgi:hypothetical protein